MVDGGTKLADVEWFWENEVHVHPLVGRAHFGRKVGRQNHDFAVDAAFSHLFDQLDAGHVRHFLIDNDDIVLLGTGIEPGKRSVTVFYGAELVAGPREDVAKGKRDRWFVVHGQNPEGGSTHGVTKGSSERAGKGKVESKN